MNAKPNNTGYSTDVQMQLHVNGYVLPIGQLGPNFIILRDPKDHVPTDAEIVMSIDGEVSRWNVRLPDGISAGRTRTRTASCP